MLVLRISSIFERNLLRSSCESTAMVPEYFFLYNTNVIDLRYSIINSFPRTTYKMKH